MTERLQTLGVNEKAKTAIAELVFEKVDFCLKNMRESGFGIRDPDEKLTPQDIFIPTVTLEPYEIENTQQILEEVVPDGFSVICVGNKNSEVEKAIVSIAAKKTNVYDVWTGKREFHRQLRLYLKGFFHEESLTAVLLEHEIGSSDPSVFYVEEEKRQWASRTSVGLGISSIDKTERVLLLVADAGNNIQITSVALPFNWKSGVENGKLFRSDVSVEVQPVQAVAVPETPKPESEAQKLQREMDESPEQAFTKIEQMVEAFPESNQKGVIARKEGLRVATLEEKGALVEMRVQGHAIVFRLSGLDREKLKICLKRGFLSTGDLLSCFKADPANPDNLIIRAYLVLGRLNFSGDMQRYDAGKGKLASSLPYLYLNPEELTVLGKVMGDSLTLVTLLTKLSPLPKKGISGDLHDDLDYPHQQLEISSRFKGSFRDDGHRALPIEQKLNAIRAEHPIEDSSNLVSVRRDTPDDKKRYWAQKARKHKPSKHK